MTVRDPAEAIGRWTRRNSGTDGESPDGRQRAAGRCRRGPRDRDGLIGVSVALPPTRPRSSQIGEEAWVFTGIVEELGAVVAVEPSGDSARLRVRGPLITADAGHGDSIAVNGVCLTVVDVADGVFAADVMAETLRRSSLGALAPGSRVNLERAARLDTRLGGHLVQGHVDGVGEILERTPGTQWELVRVSLPEQLARYIVEKGSIAVDGVSLTVVQVADQGWFSVGLIPTTLAVTTLGHKQPGDQVNLEVDVLAKYVERLLAGRTA